MLKENYVLNTVREELEKGTDPKEIGEWLGIDESTLMSIQLVHETEEKFGNSLRGHEILNLYRSGLTFNEVSWLKGVTSVAVRLQVNDLTGSKKEDIKAESKENRKNIKNRILKRYILDDSEKYGKAEALKRSGYSKAFFNNMYKELRKIYKPEQEVVSSAND